MNVPHIEDSARKFASQTATSASSTTICPFGGATFALFISVESREGSVSTGKCILEELHGIARPPELKVNLRHIIKGSQDDGVKRKRR